MERYTRTYSYKLDWQANASKAEQLINQVKSSRYTAVLFKQFEQVKLSLSTT
jgi:hypothetical protein